MSSRPRLGGQGGYLVLPQVVTVTRELNVFGQDHGNGPERSTDPFERRSDGLFLAESFARLDLTKPRRLRDWFLANGTLSYLEFAEPEEVYEGYRDFDFNDRGDELIREQGEVKSLLFSVGVLTLTLPKPAGAGWPWRPEWHPSEPWSDSIALAPGYPFAFKEPTRDNHIRLIAFLLNEFVERALAPTVILGQVGELPLNPFTRIRWTSILPPIYLQLYEALRRVSEGKPGARRCDECGETFLVLDGRRERFCTDLERARFTQREYRKRLRRVA